MVAPSCASSVQRRVIATRILQGKMRRCDISATIKLNPARYQVRAGWCLKCELAILVLPALQEVLDATPCEHLTFPHDGVGQALANPTGAGPIPAARGKPNLW